MNQSDAAPLPNFLGLCRAGLQSDLPFFGSTATLGCAAFAVLFPSPICHPECSAFFASRMIRRDDRRFRHCWKGFAFLPLFQFLVSSF